MTTTAYDRTYRCFLNGGDAHGLVVPDVAAPAPAVIECERRDRPGWVLVYYQAAVDDDEGVARYRYVTAGPTRTPSRNQGPAPSTYG